MTGDPETMLDVYKDMMKSRVAPPMRELGFRGSGGKFRIVRGDFTGWADVQKSRWNTKAEVEFTFNVGVFYNLAQSHIKGIWGDRIGSLLPDRRDKWWKIDSKEASEGVHKEVIEALSRYALPAIEVVLENPTLPPSEAELRARSLRRPRGRVGAQIREHLQVIIELGKRLPVMKSEEVHSLAVDPEVEIRSRALHELVGRIREDDNALAIVSEALIHDASSYVRKNVALDLAHVPGHRELEEPIRAAARDDDIEVRWAATYATRIRARN
jgi:hypothetical protein